MQRFPGVGANIISILQNHSLGAVRTNKRSPIRDDLRNSCDEVLLGDEANYKNGFLSFE